MPRVLYICEYGTLNGGERSLLAWLPHLRSADFEPVVLLPRDGPLAERLQGDGIEMRYWIERRAGSSSTQRPSLDERRADLRDVVRQVAPDILHANSLAMSRLSGPVAAELGVCSLGHLRDIIRISRQAMMDVNLHRQILAVSQATLKWHVAQGLDERRASVLYNGVDLEEFAPRPLSGYLHEELGLAKGTRLVATIGQIGLRKGTDVFLAAAAVLASRFDDLQFLVIGERNSGKEEAIEFQRQLHRSADAAPLKRRVHFLCYRGDVARLLNELTLLVHAARQEPLGRVLLEAAAAGAPIVATDVGGTREIVGPGFPLAPPDDAGALVEQIVRALCEDDRRQAWAEQLTERVARQFDAADSAARLTDAYHAPPLQ